jgi:hypothetical protein
MADQRTTSETCTPKRRRRRSAADVALDTIDYAIVTAIEAADVDPELIRRRVTHLLDWLEGKVADFLPERIAAEFSTEGSTN